MRQRTHFLPVTESILLAGRKRPPVALVVVQHVLDDTAEFVTLLRDNGFYVRRVIGIEYSASAAAQRSIVDAGIDCVVPSLTKLRTVIRRTLRELHNERMPLIVHEVGGYCADILRFTPQDIPKPCMGFVEETKQGLWRYRKLSNVRFPIMQIAESRLKDIEGPYVGRAVAESVLEDTSREGLRADECTIGILGLGIIGSSVAKSLASRFHSIHCWDSNPIACVEALADGLPLASRAEVMSSDVIVGATGAASLRARDLRDLRDGVIVASASSRRIELPVRAIRSLGRVAETSGYVQKFVMPWGKSIRLVNDGCPINFRRRSLPTFIGDLMFAQIASCIGHLRAARQSPGIQQLPDDKQMRIAEAWLACHGRAASGQP